MLTLKTLDEGSVVSELDPAQNPGGKTLKETLGFSILSEKCSGVVSVSEVSIRENVGEDGVSNNDKDGIGKNCFHFGGIEKALLVNEAVAEEIHMKGSSLKPDFEDERLKMNNETESVREMSLIRPEKVLTKDNVEEGDTPLLNEIGSCNNVDASVKGISLFVEVFGSLDGLVQGDDSNCFNVHKENGDLLLDNQEFNFSVGEFVWAKTTTQSWWPGLICDPSKSSEDAEESDQRDCLLVKSFGNGSFVWCESSEMKPFLEYFEQMSRQTNSRSFLNAVDNAVCEFGMRVKREMTCSCFSKDSNTKLVAGTEERDTVRGKNPGELGEFSLTRFEPANFLAYVKYLALDVSVPGRIVSTVTQNRLSAFYLTLGHLQLPIHKLKLMTNANNGGGQDELEKEDDDDLTELSEDGDQDGLEKEGDDDLTELSEGDTDSVSERSGSDVSDEGTNSSRLASRSRNSKRKRVLRYRNDEEDADLENGDGVSDEGTISSRLASTTRNRNRKRVFRDRSDEEDANLENGGGLSNEGTISSRLASGSRDRKRKKVFRNGSNGKDADLEIGDGGTDGKSDKGYVSRERRKSKYLSPPYVNLSPGQDKSAPSKPMGSTPVLKSNGKRSQKKSVSRKCITGLDKSELKDVSSAKMLSVLCFAALDCLYPDESRCFDSVESFVLGFKKFVYREDIYHEIIKENTANQEMHLLRQTDKGTVKQSKIKLAAGAPDMNNTADLLPNKSGRKKKGGKNPVDSKSKPAVGLFNSVEGNSTKTGSMVIDCEKMKTGPLLPEGQPVQKKRKKKVGSAQELLQFKVIAGLPDLNENSNGLLLDDSQVTTPIGPQGKLEPKRRRKKMEDRVALKCSKSENIAGLSNMEEGSRGKFVPVLKDVQVMGPYSPQSIPELSNKEGMKEVDSSANQPGGSGMNVDPSSFLKDPQQMAFLSAGAKSESNKKIKKENTIDFRSKVTSAIPDLNGNTAEHSLLGKELPETNFNPPDGKLKPKRKSRKKEDISAASADALGTALLLKFDPEFPLPSKEALLSTFCGFGQLCESETQVLVDFGTAQIAFMANSDARDAFRSLEKSSPFGPALVNYRLHHLPAASAALQTDGNLNMPQFPTIEKPKPKPRPRPRPRPKTPRKPTTPAKPKTPAGPRTTPAKPKAPAGPRTTPAKLSPLKPQDGVTPDLFIIRQNLEIMTSMLANAGNDLSPEMRAKLESEIQGLLKKVSTMVGSSSSS